MHAQPAARGILGSPPHCTGGGAREVQHLSGSAETVIDGDPPPATTTGSEPARGCALCARRAASRRLAGVLGYQTGHRGPQTRSHRVLAGQKPFLTTMVAGRLMGHVAVSVPTERQNGPFAGAGSRHGNAVRNVEQRPGHRPQPSEARRAHSQGGHGAPTPADGDRISSPSCRLARRGQRAPSAERRRSVPRQRPDPAFGPARIGRPALVHQRSSAASRGPRPLASRADELGSTGRQQALDSRSPRLPVARSYNAHGGWMVDRRPPRGGLPGTSSSSSRGQHTAPAADPRERSLRGVDRWPKRRVVALQEAANGEPTCEPANFLLSGSQQVLPPPDDPVHPDHLRTVREPHDIRPSFAGDCATRSIPPGAVGAGQLVRDRPPSVRPSDHQCVYPVPHLRRLPAIHPRHGRPKSPARGRLTGRPRRSRGCAHGGCPTGGDPLAACPAALSRRPAWRLGRNQSPYGAPRNGRPDAPRTRRVAAGAGPNAGSTWNWVIPGP